MIDYGKVQFPTKTLARPMLSCFFEEGKVCVLEALKKTLLSSSRLKHIL